MRRRCPALETRLSPGHLLSSQLIGASASAVHSGQCIGDAHPETHDAEIQSGFAHKRFICGELSVKYNVPRCGLRQAVLSPSTPMTRARSHMENDFQNTSKMQEFIDRAPSIRPRCPHTRPTSCRRLGINSAIVGIIVTGHDTRLSCPFGKTNSFGCFHGAQLPTSGAEIGLRCSNASARAEHNRTPQAQLMNESQLLQICGCLKFENRTACSHFRTNER